MKRLWTLLAFAAAAIAFSPFAWAHQELYHNMEIDLAETAESGVFPLYFTIHAPELLVGSEEAADAMYDTRWLGERSDAELEKILKLARLFVAKSFAVGFEGEPAMDLENRIRFEDFDRIRNAELAEESGLSPACLLGTVELAVLPKATRLRVENGVDSGKRLMLVVVRPKSFPEVVDLDVGKAVTVTMPMVERSKAWRNSVSGAIFIALLGIAVILQALRGRRLAKRMLARGG